RLAATEEGSAAICSNIAARLANIPVLFDNIEDGAQNTTRFLVLSKNFVNQKSNKDKTTIIANLHDTNKPGTLFKFLKEFNERGINLTQIESRPLKQGSTFLYWFLVEFEGHYEDKPVQEILETYGTRIKLLGSYVNGG